VVILVLAYQETRSDQAVPHNYLYQSRRITEQTGTPHHVDHIIPLRGKNVSGLHVHQNLRIISSDENQRKNNKFLPELL